MWSQPIRVTITGSAYQQNWTGFVSPSPQTTEPIPSQCDCVARVSMQEWISSALFGRSSLLKMTVLWERCAAHANGQPETTQAQRDSLQRRIDKETDSIGSGSIARNALWL